ncbi:MAG: hypothetical protein V2A78_00540 [bacterium]
MNNELIKVYWKKDGVFSEEHSLAAPLYYDQDFGGYDFELSPNALREGSITLMIGRQPALIEIGEIAFSDSARPSADDNCIFKCCPENHFEGLSTLGGVIPLPSPEAYTCLGTAGEARLLLDFTGSEQGRMLRQASFSPRLRLFMSARTRMNPQFAEILKRALYGNETVQALEAAEERDKLERRIRNLLKKFLIVNLDLDAAFRFPRDFLKVVLREFRDLTRKRSDSEFCPRGDVLNLKEIRRITGEPFVVFLAHSDYLKSCGGTEKYQLEDAQVCRKYHLNVLQIHPEQEEADGRFGLNVNRKKICAIPRESVMILLRKLCASKKMVSLNIHHLNGWPDELVAELSDLAEQTKILFYLHDTSFLLPDISCPENPKCGLRGLPGKENETLRAEEPHAAGRRALTRRLLDASHAVIYPSRFIERALFVFAPDLDRKKMHFVEHQSLLRHPVGERVRIAFLGYKASSKGWETFTRLAADPGLLHDYLFYHIGSTLALKENNILQVPYSYNSDESYAPITNLLKHEIDLVLLWSQVPESYSYTLHEAHAAGVPVLTSRKSGNIAEKVEHQMVYGKVFGDEKELFAFLREREKVQDFLRNRPKDILPLSHQSAFESLVLREGKPSC